MIWLLNKSKKVKVTAIPVQTWQALRAPAVWGSKISKQSTIEGCKVVSPTNRPPLPPYMLEAKSTPLS
jgi:hypothetical protein